MFFLIKDFSSEYHTETAIQLSRKNITKRNRKQKEEIEKKILGKKYVTKESRETTIILNLFVKIIHPFQLAVQLF